MHPALTTELAKARTEDLLRPAPRTRTRMRIRRLFAPRHRAQR